MSSQPYIQQPFNEILAQKHDQVRGAVRVARGTMCNPDGTPRKTSAQLRRQLKTIQINASNSGDNIIIPALAGVKQIFELMMWNVDAQTIIWQQGTSGSNAIIQTSLTTFPALTGLLLGFNGNWDMPHWEIDNGQPLVLNLSGGSQVDGYIRYRVQNGSA